MGNFWSHVLSGLFFFTIGLWHLYNHIKLHTLDPNSYTSLPWFPTSKLKHSELIFTMAFSSFALLEELYLRPYNHRLLNPNGTLPIAHLTFLEHSSIFATFFLYALFAIILDRLRTPTRHHLTFFLTALAYAQLYSVLHFHTADHMGPEAQYHLLLRVLILVTLAATLLGMGFRKSFIVSFVRSLGVLFIGVWDVFIGVMLWTPSLLAEDCLLREDEVTGQNVVRCSGEESLRRAKSLVNLQFSWFVVGVAVFGVSLYLVLVKIYEHKVEYSFLNAKEEEDYLSYNVEDVKAHNSLQKLGGMLPVFDKH